MTDTTTAVSAAREPWVKARLVKEFCRLLGWDVDRKALIVRENPDYGTKPNAPATLPTAVTYPDMAQRAVYDTISYYRAVSAQGQEAAGPPPQFEPTPYGDGQRQFARIVYQAWVAGTSLSLVEAAMVDVSRVLTHATQGAPGFKAPTPPTVLAR